MTVWRAGCWAFVSLSVAGAAPGKWSLENEGAYQEFADPVTGRWVPTHRRVAEKKFGSLRRGFRVHHLDGNKLNNHPENLVEVHAKVHRRIHAEADVCLRCGRSGHWARACYASTFFDGTPLEE